MVSPHQRRQDVTRFSAFSLRCFSFRPKERKKMQLIKWFTENPQAVPLLFGILINLAGLAYNLYEYIRSGKGRDVRGWLLMLEAARQFEMEAEATAGLDSAGKLAFALEKLNAFAAGQGLPFDAEKCRRQVEEDIAFTRQVNAK